MDLQVFTSSEQLPEGWDAFLPREHFLKKEQLRITEISALPGLQYVYVWAKHNGEPVAAAYFQVLHMKPEHLNSKLTTGDRSFLWKLFTGIARPKLLVAGHLFRHDVCSYYWKTQLSPFEAYQYYKESIDAALAHSHAMAVLVKDTASELHTYFTNFAPQYLLLRNDISMEMEIPGEWQGIGDYEKALKHKYAQRMRKIRSTWAGLRVHELSEQEVEENKERLFNLYRQVTERQRVRMGFLSPEFIVNLKVHYKDQLKVWGIYEHSRLVAFYSAWIKGGVFDMFYIGIEYSRNADLQLYFNILFFSIEQATKFRCRKLVLGRTALDAKARLGCTPRYLSTYLYISNSFVRKRVLDMQSRNTEQEGAWEERHPFKNR